jgi:alkanesulfonate monooxygenase SsuD/methylene tetrahydromethanopterin reductase-like flavin-dependent oxidoreductase (luciferase family)
MPEILEANGWMIGTPDRILAQLQMLAEEGVERVILQHNDPTDFEALELIAAEVMPGLAG